MLARMPPMKIGDRWRSSACGKLLQKSSDAYALTAVAISVLATCYYQWAATFWWGGSDHLDHLAMAWWFLHMPHGADAPWRTPGMAFFLIATGVPIFNTWKGLIVAFALMGAAIPMFIYFIVSPVSRPLGLIAAMLMIVSGIPFIYSKTGFTEQLFHFLHFLSLFLALRYFRFGSTPTLFALTAALFALCLVRPVPAFYFWIFIVVAIVIALVENRSVRPLLAAVLVYAVAMGSWALMSRAAGTAFFSPNLPLMTTAQKRAAEVYFGGPIHPLDQTPRPFAIDPNHGPASHRLYTVLIDHIRKTAAQWQAAPSAERPALLFGDPSRDPEAMATTVLSTPIFSYFDLIREAAHAELGDAGGEQLLYSVAQEYGTAGFEGAVHYILNNPIRLVVGGSPPMGNRNFFGLFLQTRLRYSLGRFYTLDVGMPAAYRDRWDDYAAHPTPQGLRDVLLSVDPLQDADIVHEDNGPASRELFQGLRLFMDAYPTYWQSENPWLAQYKDNPQGVVAEIFRSPLPGETGIYEGFLYESLTALFGYAQADRIYEQAAWETLRKYPFSAAIIWDNFLRATIIPTFGDISLHLTDRDVWDSTRWTDMLFVVRHTDYTSLTPGLAGELPAQIFMNAYERPFYWAYAGFHVYFFVFSFAAIVMLVPALRSSLGPFVAFLTVAYLYDGMVVAVYGNFGDTRYYDVFRFLPVLITLIGWGALCRSRGDLKT